MFGLKTQTIKDGMTVSEIIFDCTSIQQHIK